MNADIYQAVSAIEVVAVRAVVHEVDEAHREAEVAEDEEAVAALPVPRVDRKLSSYGQLRNVFLGGQTS